MQERFSLSLFENTRLRWWHERLTHALCGAKRCVERRRSPGAVKRLCAAALCAAPFAHAAQAQEALTPPEAAVGRVAQFEITAQSRVEQGAAHFSLSQHGQLRCEASEANAKDALFLCTFEQLSTEQSDGAKTSHFAWTKEKGVEHAEGEAPSPLALLHGALVASTLRVRVARNGEVTSVEGYGDVAKAMAQAPGAGAALLGVFAPSTIAANVAPVFGSDLPREGERKESDAWTRMRSIPAGPNRAIVMATTWRASPVTDGAVTLTGETNVTLEQDNAAGYLAATGEIVKTDAGVETIWSIADGALISRTSRLNMTSKWTIGDVTVEQTLESSVELRSLTVAVGADG